MTGELTGLCMAMLAFGLTGGGLAAIVRVLPWPETWKQSKPLGCALCMGFWASLTLMLAVRCFHGAMVWWPELSALMGDTNSSTIVSVALTLMGATGIASVINNLAAPRPERR